MRWILAVVALIALLVGGAAVYLLTNLDAIVKSAIEEHGSEITGVQVRVGSVEIVLTEGRGTLRGVSIANPAGYVADHAFTLGDITLDIDPASVTESPIVVDAVTVSAPDVAYELDAALNSNIQTILDNVERYSASGGDAPAEGDASGEPTLLRIARFTFRDGEVAADTSAVGGKELDVKLPPLELTNLGGSAGAPPGEIGSQVADAYLNVVIRTVAKKQLGKQLKKGKKKVKKALKGLLD